MNRKKIMLIGIPLIGLVGLVVYHVFWGSANHSGRIETSGHIEVTEVDMSFRIAGHVSRLLVEEGQAVKRGETLAELKTNVLEAANQQAEARVRQLQAYLDSMDLAIRINEEVLAAQVEQAEAGRSAAEARYQTLKRGSREQEIKEAAAARDSALTQFENRRRDYERMKNLHATQVISTSEFDGARTAFEAAQASLEAAQERYSLVKAGPRREAVSEGLANLTGSGAALAAAKASQREVEKLKLDRKALLAQLDEARAAWSKAQDDLAESRLFAPFDGFVTVKNVEEGEFVQVGTPVATLAELNRVWVKTYVPETQLGRVRLGQSADVKSDTYPDKVYSGMVTYISQEAEFTPKNVQTKEERVKLVYRIKVSLDNPNQELKAGMPVDVILQ